MRGENTGSGVRAARGAVIAATIGALALCASAASAQTTVVGASRETPSPNAQSSASVTATTSASSDPPSTTPPASATATAATSTTAPTAASLLVAPSELLDAAEADVRTAWIQSRLDAETPAAQRWYWIFLTLNATAAGGQFALGALFPREFGAPAYVGGVNGVIGTLPMVIFPFTPAFAAGRLRGMPSRTPAQRIERARRAESLLRECAEGEAFGQSWVSHGLGVVVAVGSSLVLWLALDQAWYWVLTNLVTTVAFNELQVLTQPMQLVSDWDTYRRAGWRNLASGASSSSRRRRGSDVRVVPVPVPGGAGISVVF